MTDIITRPGDVCPESAAADIPTGFQLACGTMGVGPSLESVIAARPEFNAGWEAGVENKLWTDVEESMPLGVDLDAAEGRKAYLVGFIAGQYSYRNEFANTPFCVIAEHGSECKA